MTMVTFSKKEMDVLKALTIMSEGKPAEVSLKELVSFYYAQPWALFKPTEHCRASMLKCMESICLKMMITATGAGCVTKKEQRRGRGNASVYFINMEGSNDSAKAGNSGIRRSPTAGG